jgi:hypothetical protein
MALGGQPLLRSLSSLQRSKTGYEAMWTDRGSGLATSSPVEGLERTGGYSTKSGYPEFHV